MITSSVTSAAPVGAALCVPAVVESSTIVGMVVELLSLRVNAGADSLESNLTWLLKRTKFPTPGLMAAFVYLDRFLSKFPKTRFREPMRPLVTCLILGMKFTEDAVYSNETWGSLLGIPLATINECELEFLSYLDFALFISDDDFADLRSKADAHLGFVSTPTLASLPAPSSVCDMDTTEAPKSSSPPPSASSSPAPLSHVAKPESPPQTKPMDVSPSALPPVVPTARAATRRGGIFRRLVGAVKGSWRAD